MARSRKLLELFPCVMNKFLSKLASMLPNRKAQNR